MPYESPDRMQDKSPDKMPDGPPERKYDPEQFHENLLDYGTTDGENIHGVDEGLLYVKGYNSENGLLDVVSKKDGKSVLHGSIPVKNLVEKIEGCEKEEIDRQVHEHLDKGHDNYRVPGTYENHPPLEVELYEQEEEIPSD